MERKTDLRIIKTKKAIKTAFLNLRYKVFQECRIICKFRMERCYQHILFFRCNDMPIINRKTFYAHYETKDELYADVIEDALRVLSPANVLNEIGTVETEKKKKEFIYQTLLNWKKNKDMLSALLSENSDGTFQQKLMEQLSQIVISKKEVAKNLEGTPFDIDVICNIYFNTFFCILSHWIEGDSQDPMQPMEMITHIFSKEYLGFLGLS